MMVKFILLNNKIQVGALLPNLQNSGSSKFNFTFLFIVFVSSRTNKSVAQFVLPQVGKEDD